MGNSGLIRGGTTPRTSDHRSVIVKRDRSEASGGMRRILRYRSITNTTIRYAAHTSRKIRKREGVCRECDRPSPGHTLCLVHRRLSCLRAQDAYQKRRAAGVCASCVARAAPGRVHCRACGVARRKITSAKRRNQTRLAAGLCPRCTAPLALGRVSCAGCLSDRRVARRARKAKWATANLCMKCGGAREDTRLHCAHCRAQSYAYKKQYRVDGLCQCGRFRADGRQSCESCLRIHREYQRRRRASLPGRCAILAVQGKTRAMNAGFRS